MIPLISSLCYGPLEVCQLPRTWWKTILRRKGLLDEEYPDCSPGLDTGVLNALGLDKDATLGYLRDALPDYLTFEKWVVAQKGGNLPMDEIAKWNENVRHRVHRRPEKLAEVYGDIGLSPDCGIDDAVILNSTQDWQLFVKRDLDSDFAGIGGRVVPLISSLDYGTLGVCQLPRTWLKIALHIMGRLHPDYPHMTENGLDPRVLRLLGLEPHDAIKQIVSAGSSYVEFEAWVRDAVGEPDRAAVEEWNTFIRTRTHNERKLEEIRATLGEALDVSVVSATVLNHVEDWHYAHADLV
ncbi:MAG: DUF5069 domain-containing protein [Candidatus Poribacteria bacterium]|nr:DUF5069 domain-containing protein [Candidatus Poribacteria bacterium]